MSIRPLHPGAIASLLDLLAKMDAEDGNARCAQITAPHLEEVVFGPRPVADALVAEDAGRLIGRAAFHMSASTFWSNVELSLDDLFVVLASRRSGVARDLVAELARVTRSRDASRILWNVQSDNSGALGSYTSIGANVFPDPRTCSLTSPALEDQAGRSSP